MLATGVSTLGTERRLPQTFAENATWKCGVLQTKLFEPFEILRHLNHESSGNEKENSIFPVVNTGALEIRPSWAAFRKARPGDVRICAHPLLRLLRPPASR